MGAENGAADSALNAGLVEVVATDDASAWIGRELGRWEYPLPAPIRPGARIFSNDGVGELDARRSLFAVVLVELADALDVPGHGLFEGSRKERCAIAVAFAFSDDELASLWVEILDAESQALEKPEAGTVEKSSDQGVLTLEMTEHCADFVTRHDDGKALRRSGAHGRVQAGEFPAEYLRVEEDERRERLILRRRRDASGIRRPRWPPSRLDVELRGSE